ncbi:helix-turn-helix domain-containing protein [Chryseobacterium tongliaoense]|uniref:helix-turn-helix domain-containing protein n=1 Tax=Chryseobacterium tongliaoense TaxID=3240933 RepID=UPI0035130C18
MKIVSLDHPSRVLFVESLDYNNPYDFTKIHKHDYFEILFIQKGGGSQLIDDQNFNLEDRSIFVIHPGQVHLLNRETAEGRIIQFGKDIFAHLFPVEFHHLLFKQPKIVVSEMDFFHLYSLTEHISKIMKQDEPSSLAIFKSYSYLQIILIHLIEKHCVMQTKNSSLATRFLELLSLHIKDKKNVVDYATMLYVSADTLNQHCKLNFGKTPLNLINEEVVKETKRLMLLGTHSIIEIAYELNFNSPSNFSSFIKKNTGKTPKQLNLDIKNII